MTLFARLGNGGRGAGCTCAAGAVAVVCAGCGALEVCGCALAICCCAPAWIGTVKSTRTTIDERLTPFSLRRSTNYELGGDVAVPGGTRPLGRYRSVVASHVPNRVELVERRFPECVSQNRVDSSVSRFMKSNIPVAMHGDDRESQ
jgi:hypothetical protein